MALFEFAGRIVVQTDACILEENIFNIFSKSIESIWKHTCLSPQYDLICKERSGCPKLTECKLWHTSADKLIWYFYSSLQVRDLPENQSTVIRRQYPEWDLTHLSFTLLDKFYLKIVWDLLCIWQLSSEHRMVVHHASHCFSILSPKMTHCY